MVGVEKMSHDLMPRRAVSRFGVGIVQEKEDTNISQINLWCTSPTGSRNPFNSPLRALITMRKDAEVEGEQAGKLLTKVHKIARSYWVRSRTCGVRTRTCGVRTAHAGCGPANAGCGPAHAGCGPANGGCGPHMRGADRTCGVRTRTCGVRNMFQKIMARQGSNPGLPHHGQVS